MQQHHPHTVTAYFGDYGEAEITCYACSAWKELPLIAKIAALAVASISPPFIALYFLIF